MKSATIIQLAKLATKRPNLCIEITKVGAGEVYQVLGFIKVESEIKFQRVGETGGVSFIYFKDRLTDQIYARHHTEFSNFMETVY